MTSTLCIDTTIATAQSRVDEGYRHYVEDIDLSYRAMKAGWERWWVPDAVVHHEYQAVIDKHFFTRRNLWHLHAMMRFLRKHPERLFALR
jgi:GT2 family glycosyltransferase